MNKCGSTHVRTRSYPWPWHLWFVAVVATQRIPRLLLYMVEAIAILTVKVDVDPIRVIIVLTRVTSEKLTRRKDHADNRPASAAFSILRALLEQPQR